jgi:hypothetical protein
MNGAQERVADSEASPMTSPQVRANAARLSGKEKIRSRPHQSAARGAQGVEVSWPRDQVREFIAVCCQRDPCGRERASVLLAAHTAWARAASKPILTANMFGRALTALGYLNRKSLDHFWFGLRRGVAAGAPPLAAGGSKLLPNGSDAGSNPR